MSLLGLDNEKDKGWSAPESTQLMLIKITSNNANFKNQTFSQWTNTAKAGENYYVNLLVLQGHGGVHL